jgi:hypothetical protein
MGMQFSMASHEARTNGVKVCVYAGSGLGKTVLAATAPVPLLISAESGLLSLSRANLERLHGVNNPTICYDVPIIKVSDVDGLSEAYRFVSQSQDAKHFQTVCLDSISEIAEVVLNNAKRQVKDPRQAYGELIEKMESLIRLFRDLPGKHVYMAAKMEPIRDEMSGIVKYGPSMPGAKLGVKLPYFFDEVFRLGVNKDPQGVEYRFLQTQPDLQYEAKDRSGMLAKAEYPSLTSVFTKIQGAQ